jgi:septum formation protein
MSALWLAGEPLVLASGSVTRRLMLTQAGVPCDVQGPAIDERAVEQDARDGGVPSADIAGVLAAAKAIDVSRRMPGRLVLGADQTLTLGDMPLHKPRDRPDAARQLASMAGREHQLRSAAAVAHNGEVLFEAATIATLSVRALSEDAIRRYLDTVGQAVTTSVGGYQVEGAGVTLFEAIDGDHFTIMGLPLLPLLAWFRAEGLMP